MAVEDDLTGCRTARRCWNTAHPSRICDAEGSLPPARITHPSSPARSGRRAAARLVAEVPEVKGVIRAGSGIPGITDTDAEPMTHTLLAGCDVRADIFPTRAGPVVIYKQQSTLHIEFPRDHNEKILTLEREIGRRRPRTFVDACSGAGTPRDRSRPGRRPTRGSATTHGMRPPAGPPATSR